MSGRLVMIAGASGAGKDTLLAFAQARLRHRDDIVFIRRVITRPADATEAHEPADAAAFCARSRAGGFALEWQAHGLSYGIPRAIEADIAAGKQIIANVSRGVIGAARIKFPCFVVEITAGAKLRAARLAQRGREESENIAARLQRGGAEFQPDAVIVNDGAIEAAGARLLALIDSRES